MMTLSADMYDLMTEMLGENQVLSNMKSVTGRNPVLNRAIIFSTGITLPYLGLGPGAHGFADGVRYIVMRSPQKYIDAMNAN